MALIKILYAEDFLPVKLIVKETLEFEGWHVEDCDDGLAALSRIESREHFDLILLDDDLPGLSGVELAARARSLGHRSRTPVIMLSATERGSAASAAGVRYFPEETRRHAVARRNEKTIALLHRG